MDSQSTTCKCLLPRIESIRGQVPSRAIHIFPQPKFLISLFDFTFLKHSFSQHYPSLREPLFHSTNPTSSPCRLPVFSMFASTQTLIPSRPLRTTMERITSRNTGMSTELTHRYDLQARNLALDRVCSPANVAPTSQQLSILSASKSR